jgi:hypothetical protein
MLEPAEDRIVQNLVEALEQLRQDLDRVEMWAAALGYFQRPAPEYQPDNQYILPPSSQGAASRPRDSNGSNGRGGRA